MNRLMSIVFVYARRSALEWMGFRSFLVTLVFNQSIAPMVGLALWSAALPERSDTSAYYVALLVVQLATASQEYYTVTLRIYEGTLSEDMLKPHSPVLIPLGEGLAWRILNLGFGMPIVVIMVLVVGVEFRPENLLLFCPALLMAMILRFLFEYILALSALWIEQASAIGEYGNTITFLLGGIAVPVMLFPDRLKSLVEALPFRSMVGFPAEVASGNLDRSQVIAGFGWQVVWGCVMAAMAVWVWHAGARRFTAVGG